MEGAGILLKFKCFPFGGGKIVQYIVTSNCSKKIGLGFHNYVLYFLLTFLFYSLVLHHNFEFFPSSFRGHDHFFFLFQLYIFIFGSSFGQTNIINHFQTNGLDCTIILIMMLVVKKSCFYNSDHTPKKKTLAN